MELAHVKTVLGSRGYVLGGKISAGSFAVVRNILDKEAHKTCAVKLIDRSNAPEEFVKKFLPKEIDIIRRLQHKYVVDTREILEIGWYTCIVMDKAEGGDMLSYISKRGSLEEDRARIMFAQMVLALKYIHDQNVAHRDIKCENILLDKKHNVKFADFGFARYTTTKGSSMKQLSETYCGSAAYAAPEILMGCPYNPMMADVWSLGIVLYVMMCGIMPFDDGDHNNLLRLQQEKRWSWHPDKKGSLSVPLRRAVKGMMDPDVMTRMTLRRLMQSDWLAPLVKTQSCPQIKTVMDIFKGNN